MAVLQRKYLLVCLLVLNECYTNKEPQDLSSGGRQALTINMALLGCQRVSH